MSRAAHIEAAGEPPPGRAAAIGRALLRCRLHSEALVVGAVLVVRALDLPTTAANIAWAISVAQAGKIVQRSFVARGLARAVRNGTLTRADVGVYEPGPLIADLIDDERPHGASR